MAQIDTLTNVGAVVSTDLALILRGGANVLGTFGSLVGQNATSVTITGGTVNNTVIGGVTPAAGSFTTLGTTGAATFSGAVSLNGAAQSDSITNTLYMQNLAGTRAANIQLDASGGVSIFDYNGSAWNKSLTLEGGAATFSGAIITTTLGTSNFRAGVNAGNSIIAGGNYNVLVGDQAGAAITTGDDNTFIGYAAGDATTTGSYNTALGRNTFGTNTTGQENTALGREALFSNTTGNNNVAVGQGSLLANTTASNNTAVGYDSLKANTTGPYNTAVGWASLDANTTGAENVALGADALGLNTTGNNNVAIGTNALDANTTASNITAVGYQALTNNTTGASNTAVGANASWGNTTGSSNVAVGETALNGTSTGSSNVGVGYQALYSNQTGGGNIAIGRGALYTNTASNNTAVGYLSLAANTTGASNTAVGSYALQLTTGAGNTAVGMDAGDTLTAGNWNIYVGPTCRPSSGGIAQEIVLGTRGGGAVIGKGNNTAFIDPNGGGTYQGNNATAWTQVSDRRLKKNIVDNTEGLELINAIRVRNFEYRVEDEVTELDPTTAIAITGVQLGVIAQELEEVCPDCVKEESTGIKTVLTDDIMWHMLNAIKQLSAQNEALTARLETLEG